MQLKILILEDNPVDAYLLLQELKKSGYDFLHKIVEKEDDYLKELNTFAPDIILSDFFLNSFSGIKALRIAKEKYSEIPFIMVTGSIDEETAVQCMKSGADDYITKGHFYRISNSIITAIERKKDREEKLSALKKLNESEERFRGLFNNMTIGLYRTTPEGQIIFVNPTLLKMLGYETLNELDKRNLEEDGYEPNYPRKIFKEKIDSFGYITGLESIWKKKNGTFLFVRESARAIRDEQGNILFYEGTVEDISDLRKTEFAYAEKERLYKIIFDQSVNGIFLVDSFSGKIIESNEAFRNILGYSAAELEGLNSAELITACDPLNRNNLEETLFLESLSGEKIYKTKNGELITALVSVSRLNYRERNILCFIIKDITKQKEVENELAKNRYFLQQILETLPNILYIYDFKDHNIKFINFGQAGFLGLKEKEILSKPLMQEMLHPEDKDAQNRHLESLNNSRGKEVFEYEFRLKESEGDYTWFRAYEAVFLRDEAGSPVEILGVAVNITENKIILEEYKKSKEAAEAANKAKGDFLANMSHEIRTPLNGIIGLTNLLLSSELNQKQKEYTDLIKTSSNSLLSIINDILDFSKIESRKVKLSEDNISIHDLVAETIKLFEIDAKNRKISLYCEIDKRINYILIADHIRIKQILFNLLSNALKFTAKGFIKLCVKEILREAEIVTLAFSVSDTGIGIPEEKINLIFERFSQLDSSYTKKYAGSGLGLAIVKSIVDSMGGNIYVESTEDHGTTFTCELPFRLSEIIDEPKRQEAAISPNNMSHSRKVLLVEDDFVNQLYVKTILKEKNYDVSVANNGNEALNLMTMSQFDLILMDGQMPIMDGFEATRKIREAEKSTKGHIPIIALTAYALNEEKNKCFESGMDDYISKPIDEILLFSTIEKYISKK